MYLYSSWHFVLSKLVLRTGFRILNYRKSVYIETIVKIYPMSKIKRLKLSIIYDKVNKQTKNRGKDTIMSKSTIVKAEILEILQDEKMHYASEIKDIIRKKHTDFDVTEGIFSNSFRTLTLAGKCKNPERGVYCVNGEKNESTTQDKEQQNKEFNENSKSKDSVKEDKKISAICLEVENFILQRIHELRGEFTEMVKNVNVVETDDETVMYILKVRQILEGIEQSIKL